MVLTDSETHEQMKEGATLMTKASPKKYQGIKSKTSNLLAWESHGRSTVHIKKKKNDTNTKDKLKKELAKNSTQANTEKRAAITNRATQSKKLFWSGLRHTEIIIQICSEK